MSEVEADAGDRRLGVALQQRDQRGRRRQRVRNHLEGDAHAQRLGVPADLLDAARGRRAIVVPGAGLRLGRPQVDDQDAERNPPGDGQRRGRLVDRRLAPGGVCRGIRERSAPTDPRRRTVPLSERARCAASGRSPPASPPARPRQPDRDSRNGSASRTARFPRTRSRRSAPDAAGRAAGRDRGAWISRTAWTFRVTVDRKPRL